MNPIDTISYDDNQEFNVYLQSESIDDWSCGHDETGHLVFDYEQFVDHLRLEDY